MRASTDPHAFSHELIESQADFEAVVREISRSPELAVDTEQNSYFAYTTRICLVQLSIRNRSWVVDPQGDINLAIMGDLFADTSCMKIFHAGENDIIQFKKEYSFSFRNIFDTMAAPTNLGMNRVGLAPLLEHVYGISLEKKYQKADWERRPLSHDMIDYAARDTAYLIQLKNLLTKRLQNLGRVEEAHSEFEHICAAVANGKKASPHDFLRIRGARTLDPVTMRVLRDLFLLRDRVAKRLDRALFRVISDSGLLEIARRKPASIRALRRMRGVSATLAQSEGRNIIELIAAAVRKGPLRLKDKPPPPSAIPPILSVVQKRCYDALRQWRIDRAAKRGVEISLVAKSSLLLDVAIAMPRNNRELREIENLEPWRFKEYGEDILRTIKESVSPDR